MFFYHCQVTISHLKLASFECRVEVRAGAASKDRERLARRGRGRGRGRGLARGARNAAQGRAPAASSAAADEKQMFNPYQIPDAGMIKGGKRSAVAPRSGNKNMTFGWIP